MGLAGTAAILLTRATAMTIRGPRTIVVAAVCAGAAITADARDPWQRFIESATTPAGLAVFAGNSREIYWERGVDVLWFKLGRSSYYSCLQGTGAMFFRNTAVDYQRRTEGISLLPNWDTGAVKHSGCASTTDALAPRTSGDLAAACHALGELDSLILTRPVAGMSGRVWSSPSERTFIERGQVYRINRFYRYDCAAMRRLPAASINLIGVK
jgi:hypothetical protein